MRSILFVLMTFLLSQAAIATPTTRVLRSGQGNTIGLLYDVKTETNNSNKPSSANYASPLQAAVTGDLLSSQDQVTIVLINDVATRGQCGVPDSRIEKVYRMLMRYNPNKKTFYADFLQDAEMQIAPNVWAKINSNYISSSTGIQMSGAGYCYTSQGTLEVAVVINGVWQIDPVNRSHNFKVMF